MTKALVQSPSINQFAPSGTIIQSGSVVSTEPWFKINGQPVITSGCLAPWTNTSNGSSGSGVVVGFSHWLVNGKKIATLSVATAAPLGVAVSHYQSVPYFDA